LGHQGQVDLGDQTFSGKQGVDDRSADQGGPLKPLAFQIRQYS
jgi:hypothetical protein